MIAIVCGSRTYTDAARVKQVLDAAVVRLNLHTIIEGDCPTDINADKLARQWAIDRGDISVITCPADWAMGAKAGPIRNAMMLDILLGGEPDAVRGVIAFPSDGPGTKNMLMLANSPKARAGNVRVILV